jgi:putative ABC transport system permease protein
LLAIIGAALAYTGVAVANTQLMATTGRAGDLATLRLAGASTGQVRRTIASEALVALVAG